MTSKTQYESGARKSAPKINADDNDNVSTQAAKNKLPPGGTGNSEAYSPRDTRDTPSDNPVEMAEDAHSETLPNDDDPLVRELAEQTDVSPLQARNLIKQHGHDREKLFEIARLMKAES